MPLSPSELSALQGIERELSLGRSRPAAWRRTSTWIGLWVVGAAVLVVLGLVLGNQASLVLGVAWAVGAVTASWATRHLTLASDGPPAAR